MICFESHHHHCRHHHQHRNCMLHPAIPRAQAFSSHVAVWCLSFNGSAERDRTSMLTSSATSVISLSRSGRFPWLCRGTYDFTLLAANHDHDDPWCNEAVVFCPSALRAGANHHRWSLTTNRRRIYRRSTCHNALQNPTFLKHGPY